MKSTTKHTAILTVNGANTQIDRIVESLGCLSTIEQLDDSTYKVELDTSCKLDALLYTLRIHNHRVGYRAIQHYML